MVTANDILKFWFTEIKPVKWFKKDRDFDCLIRDRFEETLGAASQGELFIGGNRQKVGWQR